MWRAGLTAMLLIGSTLPATAARIDIDDPALLGPVLISMRLWHNPYENLVTEVRYAGGIYSYISAVETNIYALHWCCRAGLASFAITGHPLEETWGAINSSTDFWYHHEPGDVGGIYGLTKPVESITPVYDGFLVVPESSGRGFTVVYMQSPLPPSRLGILTYTAFGCVTDHDPDTGQCVQGYRSYQTGGFLTPVPEPSSLVLLGLGLASLAAKRRAIGWRAVLTTMLLIGSAHPALAARIDIADPALLGPVLISIDVHQGFDYESLTTQVRYEDGVYSYIYAVQTTPYFPGAWGLLEGEPSLVSVAVTGRPLGGAWGAIYSSSAIWGGFNSPTNVVESITPIDDGFIAIPQGNGAGSFTVVYWQSPRPPAFDGTVTYTAKNYCYSRPRCFNADGSRRYEFGSFDETVFAPVPEPGSFALLGSGLIGLYAAVRHRRAAKLSVSRRSSIRSVRL